MSKTLPGFQRFNNATTQALITLIEHNGLPGCDGALRLVKLKMPALFSLCYQAGLVWLAVTGFC